MYPEIDGGIVACTTKGGPRSVELRLPKLSVVPVLAVPETADPAAVLKPAGAVYPWHLGDDGRLRLDWIYGFACSALMDCGISRAQAVNVTKLVNASIERSSGNPWRLDASAVSLAVERGNLTSHSLKLLPTFDVDVHALPGTWISGNPLDSSSRIAVTAFLEFTELPVGIHSFFEIGTGNRVGISVSEDGWVVVDPTREDGSDGSW
jgi:hypothetical protein